MTMSATAIHPGTLLRQKVEAKRGLLVPGAANALAARVIEELGFCLLYTSPSPRDGLLSRMPSSA